MELTPLQEMFCYEYVKDFNPKLAALRAGYLSYNSTLLHNLAIATKIEALRQARRKEAIDYVDRIQEELEDIAFCDVTEFARVVEMPRIEAPDFDPDFDEDEADDLTPQMVVISTTDQMSLRARRAISSIKQGKYGIEIKMNDKLRAIELLGRMVGAFAEDNKQKKPEVHIGFADNRE